MHAQAAKRGMVLAILLVALGVAGCGAAKTGDPTPPVVAPEPTPTTAVQATASVPADMVSVPDVQGRLDADDVIEAAGLRPEGIPVHGPIDEDAAGFMEAYRQKPAPGTVVKRGTKVTYRFWWESQ